MDELSPLRPLLERPVRRPAKRIERDRAEAVGERVDDPPAEAVERIGFAVPGLAARREGVPAPTPGDADQRDRPDLSERPDALLRSKGEGAARREATAPDRGKNGLDGCGALWHDRSHIDDREARIRFEQRAARPGGACPWTPPMSRPRGAPSSPVR